MKPSKLILKDGTTLTGESFGAHAPVAGEVVFTTAMVGYVEALTDPSYAGQILVFTYPLMGNYGVPGKDAFESEKVQAAGVIVSEYSENYSHAGAKQSLGDWLKENKVPALTGIDTRMLTKKLREKGVMLGQISAGRKAKFVDPNAENLVAKVSRVKKKTYEPKKWNGTTIIAVDCGMKENIVRSLVERGSKVIRVPWDYDFNREKYDGIVLSNGPGDPMMCTDTVLNVRKAFLKKKPILGICLGSQLMALAAGASTYKLKYGHRSHNQPCIDVTTGRCYITSQNHGYAIDTKSLPKDWKVWFENANDKSVEGIRHAKLPFRSVQFHPEATPGPTDTNWIFDEFVSSVKKGKKKRA